MSKKGYSSYKRQKLHFYDVCCQAKSDSEVRFKTARFSRSWPTQVGRFRPTARRWSPPSRSPQGGHGRYLNILPQLLPRPSRSRGGN